MMSVWCHDGDIFCRKFCYYFISGDLGNINRSRVRRALSERERFQMNSRNILLSCKSLYVIINVVVVNLIGFNATHRHTIIWLLPKLISERIWGSVKIKCFQGISPLTKYQNNCNRILCFPKGEYTPAHIHTHIHTAFMLWNTKTPIVLTITGLISSFQLFSFYNPPKRVEKPKVSKWKGAFEREREKNRVLPSTLHDQSKFFLKLTNSALNYFQSKFIQSFYFFFVLARPRTLLFPVYTSRFSRIVSRVLSLYWRTRREVTLDSYGLNYNEFSCFFDDLLEGDFLELLSCGFPQVHGNS